MKKNRFVAAAGSLSTANSAPKNKANEKGLKQRWEKYILSARVPATLN
jgi:hypothetical protein